MASDKLTECPKCANDIVDGCKGKICCNPECQYMPLLAEHLQQEPRPMASDLDRIREWVAHFRKRLAASMQPACRHGKGPMWRDSDRALVALEYAVGRLERHTELGKNSVSLEFMHIYHLLTDKSEQKPDDGKDQAQPR